jgi:hypothetical protein
VNPEEAIRGLMALAVGNDDIKYTLLETSPVIKVWLKKPGDEGMGVLGGPEDDGLDVPGLIGATRIYARYGRPSGNLSISDKERRELKSEVERVVSKYRHLVSKHGVYDLSSLRDLGPVATKQKGGVKPEQAVQSLIALAIGGDEIEYEIEAVSPNIVVTLEKQGSQPVQINMEAGAVWAVVAAIRVYADHGIVERLEDHQQIEIQRATDDLVARFKRLMKDCEVQAFSRIQSPHQRMKKARRKHAASRKKRA